MRTARNAAFAATAALALCATNDARADVDVIRTEKSGFQVGGMTQVLGFGQNLRDPDQSDNRMYLFMKEARLRASGNYNRFAGHLELALGGEDAVLAPNPGVTLGLLDMNADLPLTERSYVRVGQFKVPYGREQLTYSGYSLFPERSINSLGFRVGRDVGVAAVANPGMFTVIGGVFTGGGRDVPPAHYLPQKLGVPELVARVGVGTLKEDPFELRALAEEVDHARWAVFANALYTKDSAVGHSSVLNVKGSDKSLLINGNWNPYIGAKPFSLGSVTQAGVDAAVRAPLGSGYTLAADVEANYGQYANDAGKVTLAGGVAQAAVGKGDGQVALRYAVLFPDGSFQNTGKAITGKAEIHEITPSATYFLFNRNIKLVADLPVMVNAPVFNEPRVGSYVATEMPDEATVLAKTGTVSRQTVVEGRLMFQAMF